MIENHGIVNRTAKDLRITPKGVYLRVKRYPQDFEGVELNKVKGPMKV